MAKQDKVEPIYTFSLFLPPQPMLEKKIKFACGWGASRKAGSISISKNKAPPLWLNRVKWSPFIHSHCFYHHSQCLRTKIKFACGCGASRKAGSISISKNKAPLWLNRVKWSPFIHSHCFYHHSQCLRTKIKFVCGCGASRQSKSISISKNKAPSLYG